MTIARFSAALSLAVALSSGSPARAEEQAAPPPESSATLTLCVENHERAGMLRLEERWGEAREAMQACSQESCPLALRTDCERWLDALKDMLPTLLVVVERDDDGRHPVRLSLDGRELVLAEPLRPIEVLPGTHRLEFELPPYAPLVHEVSVRPGEKNKVVRVRFAREVPPPKAPESVPPPATIAHTSQRPVPLSTYVFASGALLAFGGSGVMLAAALSRRDDARQRCAPGCYDGEREEVERLLLGADVAAAGGLVLSGLAIYTFVARPTLVLPLRGSIDVQVGPAPAVTYTGRF
jgi:hypothetical protein